MTIHKVMSECTSRLRMYLPKGYLLLRAFGFPLYGPVEGSHCASARDFFRRIFTQQYARKPAGAVGACRIVLTHYINNAFIET